MTQSGFRGERRYLCAYAASSLDPRPRAWIARCGNPLPETSSVTSEVSLPNVGGSCAIMLSASCSVRSAESAPNSSGSACAESAVTPWGGLRRARQRERCSTSMDGGGGGRDEVTKRTRRDKEGTQRDDAVRTAGAAAVAQLDTPPPTRP